MIYLIVYIQYTHFFSSQFCTTSPLSQLFLIYSVLYCNFNTKEVGLC